MIGIFHKYGEEKNDKIIRVNEQTQSIQWTPSVLNLAIVLWIIGLVENYQTSVHNKTYILAFLLPTYIRIKSNQIVGNSVSLTLSIRYPSYNRLIQNITNNDVVNSAEKCQKKVGRQAYQSVKKCSNIIHFCLVAHK